MEVCKCAVTALKGLGIIIGIGLMPILLSYVKHLRWQKHMKKEGLSRATDFLCPDYCPYLGCPKIDPYSYSDAGCLCPCDYYEIDLITDDNAQAFRCQACVQGIKRGHG